jgi:hypothetical protein
MSVKPIAAFKPFYISNGDATANIVGPWLFIEDFQNIGFQAKWDTSTGTFTFEVSNDDKAPPGENAGPVAPSGRLGPVALTLPASMTVAAATPSGTAGGFYFGFNQIEARWMRMSFVAAGGGSTGLVNVGASMKGI